MNKVNQNSLISAIAAFSLLSGISSSVLAADVFRGQNICLQIGEVQPDNYQYLMLTIPKVAKWGPYLTLPVYAVQRGSYNGISYVDPLAGSVTFAPSNDYVHPSEWLFQVALLGNGFGVQPDGDPIIWTLNFNLQLAPSLNGMIYGSSTESKKLDNGQPYKIQESTTLVAAVKPMPCASFYIPK